MAVLRLQSFGGVIPVAGDRALPEGFATESLNTWLYAEELRGVRPPIDIVTIPAGFKKVLRIPAPGTRPSDIGANGQVWVRFTDPDTDVVLSPTVNDQYDRIYWCSPTSGPMYNTYQRLRDGLPAWKLGVVGPTAALAVTVGAGSATHVTRTYSYTWVSIYGEESQPAPPFVAAGPSDAIWNVSLIADPPANAERAPYWKKILYRTITSASGVATYFKVTDIPLGTTTYADGRQDTDVGSELQLESVGWALPPADMKGFSLMPNGFLIGFNDDDVFFSEAYHPHAWPPEYTVSTEYPIVGMGIVGNTCVLCTQGYPATVTGIKPGSTALTKSTSNEPCLSRGSIVSSPQGVIYASQNGLVMVGPGGIQNVTEQLITREEWIKYYTPAYLRSARYQNGYLALRAVDSLPARTGFFLDPTALKVALTEFSIFDNVENIFPDIWSGEVFYMNAGVVKRWDPPTTDLLPVLWRSKEFQLPKQFNFGVYSIYWDQSRFAPNAIDTDIIAQDVPVRFRVFADRRLVYDQPVPKNGKPVRLPSGFKADIWQFEVRARAPVYSVHVASAERELVQV